MSKSSWYRCVATVVLAAAAAACGSTTPAEKSAVPAWERENPIKPLGLKDEDVDAIVAFLESLDGQGYQDTQPTRFPQ